jgi:hypothetical protein
MARLPLTLLLLAAAAAACAGPTTPDRGIREGERADLAPAFECSETDASGECSSSLPPPPPLDTTGTYEENQSSSNYIAMTYFFNKTSNNGWVAFGKNQAQGVTISPQARIDWKKGQVSAKGTMTLAMSNGQTRTIDLSRDIVRGQFSGDCTKQCFAVSFRGGGTFTMARSRLVDDSPR